jgi:hypothetical protein
MFNFETLAGLWLYAHGANGSKLGPLVFYIISIKFLTDRGYHNAVYLNFGSLAGFGEQASGTYDHES